MIDNQNTALLSFVLHLADNRLILGQRLGEWCGHGPVLEQDIALTNIALDQIGQARLLYQYASRLDPQGRDEDQLAFLRTEDKYFNNFLVEQPNGDFALTIARQFFFDVFNYLQTEQLCASADETLNSISLKSLKEIRYHLKYSSEWMLRLGDGTQESHERLQRAVDTLWRYTIGLFEPAEFERELFVDKIAFDPADLQTAWQTKVSGITSEAGISLPEKAVSPGNGKSGYHTEHMGYILTEMQYMQRAYPGLRW